MLTDKGSTSLYTKTKERERMIALGYTLSDEVTAVAALYDSVYHYLNDEVTGHTSSIILTPKEVTPAVVPAYEQHGDANRADEIAQRNGIHNPLFEPPKALSFWIAEIKFSNLDANIFYTSINMHTHLSLESCD